MHSAQLIIITAHKKAQLKKINLLHFFDEDKDEEDKMTTG